MPKRRTYILPILISICLFIFAYWLLTVSLPVVAVEVNYQYKRVLRDVFKVSDIRGVIWPKISFRLNDLTNNTVNGIYIPAIFLDEPVIYNLDPNDERTYVEALKHGIAHASSTAFPGTPKNLGYYFAHSSSPNLARQYNAVFYLLGKLKTGDKVFLWHEREKFEYEVKRSEVTFPTDVSFLRRNYDTETIVLQTCWPPGTTFQRLLVFAARN